MGRAAALLWALSLPAASASAQPQERAPLPDDSREAPAVASCGTAVNGVGLMVQVAATAAATAAEYQSMPQRDRWRMAHEPQRARVIADPSSHLHFIGSYHLARSAVRSTCEDTGAGVAAAWRGAAISLTVGLSKEISDGFYNGFSTTDLLVDAIGAGYTVAQAYVPALRHVTPTLSLAPGAFTGPHGMSGAVTAYGQQTLWLSMNVRELLPNAAARAWPSAVRLSLGRRAFSGGTAPSEYVVGLDLDPTRLPGSHPTWVKAKRAMHHLRLPGPALVLTPSGGTLVGLYW